VADTVQNKERNRREEAITMKKLLVLFVATLMAALILFGLFAGGAQAGQERDKWTKVHADWPWDHGYYKASPNGVVHEMFFCEPTWKDCTGNALYYPTSRFENPVLDTPCGAHIELFLWEGTVEYADDEGDVSEFLAVGETYWFCETYEEVFRSSE
jgi:hypothetical protein